MSVLFGIPTPHNHRVSDLLQKYGLGTASVLSSPTAQTVWADLFVARVKIGSEMAMWSLRI